MKKIIIGLMIIFNPIHSMQPNAIVQFPYVNWTQFHYSYTTPFAQAEILQQIKRNLNQVQAIVVRNCNTHNPLSTQTSHALFQYAANINQKTEYFLQLLKCDNACEMCHCVHDDTLNTMIHDFLAYYKEQEPAIAQQTVHILQQNLESESEDAILNQMGNLSMQ